MKTLRQKNNSPASSAHYSIFQNESRNNFFGKSEKPKPFFNTPPVQTKLTIGQTNDIYEKEANTKANKVAQRLSIQRQPDKVDDGVKKQVPWEDAFLAIFIEDKLHCQRDYKTNIIDCNYGYANAYGNKSLSAYGSVKTCTEPATFHFKVLFAVDALSAPRPQPFKEPFLKVKLDFIPNGKKTPTFSLHKSGKGRYAGDGQPLEVSWFPNFIFDATENGVVMVELELNDPDTGIIIKYADKIMCELFPCT